MPQVINWTLDNDQQSYATMLAAVRAFMKAKHENEYALITATDSKASVRMSSKNFEITHVNEVQLKSYNYGELGDCTLGELWAINDKIVNPTGAQKAALIFLYAEAARSSLIEKAFTNLLDGKFSNGLPLSRLAPLVKNYANSCGQAGIDSDHPDRPLVSADYRKYAMTLDEGTPSREQILKICPT